MRILLTNASIGACFAISQGRSSRLRHLRELMPVARRLPLLARGNVHWISWRDHA